MRARGKRRARFLERRLHHRETRPVSGMRSVISPAMRDDGEARVRRRTFPGAALAPPRNAPDERGQSMERGGDAWKFRRR